MGAMLKVAAVQRPPVLLQREASIEKAICSLHEAADAGAGLVVFPETYIPGYPVWIWALRPGGDYGLSAEIHDCLLANSVDLSAWHLASVQDAAAERGVVVVCGVHEREGRYSGGTMYNTLVTIGADGRSSIDIASWYRPIRSGWCGDRAMRAGCAWSTRPSAGSAD